VCIRFVLREEGSGGPCYRATQTVTLLSGAKQGDPRSRLEKRRERERETALSNHATSPSEVTPGLLPTGRRKFTFVWNL